MNDSDETALPAGPDGPGTSEGVAAMVPADPQSSRITDPPDDATTEAQLPGDEHPPTEQQLLEERAIARRRKRYYALGAVAVVLAAIVTACAFIQLPYYRFSPGNLYSTQPLITITGTQSFDDPGAIDFTTVSSKKVTILEAGLARFDPAVELIDAELIDGNRTPDETRTLNLEMMKDSKQIAEVVAARQLGYPVEVQGTGAVVKGVAKRVENILHPNDTIVAIDDTQISTADDAIAALQKHKPGDTISITIEGPPDLNTGQAPPPRTETAVLGAREKEPERAQLGVDLGTRTPSFKLPFEVDIDSKSVGGPSAGLAFTLGIIDRLTPGSLTGGKHVAVTGSMDLNGHVGEIGGIQQKTFLAQRQGADLFLVPKSELADAQRFAGNLKVIGVDDIDEALQALKDSGGETDVVQQAAAGRTGTTAPH